MNQAPPDDRVGICYFIHNLAPYGAQRVALDTVRALDRSRFRVMVCAFGGDATLASEFRAQGAEVHCLRARRFLDPAAWRRLFEALRRGRPQVVYTTLPELSVPLRLLAGVLPAFAQVHGFHNPLGSEPAGWRLLNRLTLNRCAAVTFSSEGIVEEVLEAVPAVAGRTAVIQNGVSLAEASADDAQGLRRELGGGGGTALVGCVGRITRQKGQDILIEAAARLRSSGRAVRVVLAGDGDGVRAARALARRLGMEDSVSFLGRRRDVARVLKCLDVYAAPSRWESFDIALGEAMASGLPCAAARIPGHADLLRNGETGLAVLPEDPESLAGALRRLLESPQEAARLAKAARERVRSRFTPEAMGRKYAELFAKAARSRGA